MDMTTVSYLYEDLAAINIPNTTTISVISKHINFQLFIFDELHQLFLRLFPIRHCTLWCVYAPISLSRILQSYLNFTNTYRCYINFGKRRGGSVPQSYTILLCKKFNTMLRSYHSISCISYGLSKCICSLKFFSCTCFCILFGCTLNFRGHLAGLVRYRCINIDSYRVTIWYTFYVNL